MRRKIKSVNSFLCPPKNKKSARKLSKIRLKDTSL